MSDLRKAARERLERSLADVEWAVSNVGEEKFRREAPGAWSAARNLAHLVVYEERIAAPVIEALSAGGSASEVAKSETAQTIQEEELRASEEPSAVLLTRLRSARQRQIDALQRFSDESLAASAITGRGWTSPAWVLNKTFQHTWEHGNSILQIALFWPIEG